MLTRKANQVPSPFFVRTKRVWNRLQRVALGLFDAPGNEFKLGLEAYRINLAHLFDPMMAVHTSNVEPLPHQISAVYESMLPVNPYDPGAGKTIMAGLFVRELIMRADAKRILIVSPRFID
jgi:hypothetical protein